MNRRTYGRVWLARDYWQIACEPHVRIRLKRVFERIQKSDHSVLMLSDTPENARELLWFLERYPMEIADAKVLRRRAIEHRAHEEMINSILSGEYQAPEEVALAIAPRDYQRVAAHLARRTGRLLLGDDVGLGKTCAAICAIADPASLPALVVTLTHLPKQWAAEIAKFAPKLRVHAIKNGPIYALDGNSSRRNRHAPERFPDVVICNYHKLRKWSDLIGPHIRSVVFDECQELRRKESDKYLAAQEVARKATTRIGLSATPIYNRGGEIFNVLDVIAPDALGTRQEFSREWCTGGGNGEPSITDPKAFGTYLRDQGLLLRRTRAEVGRELPPLTKVPHLIEADLEALDKIEATTAELAKIILAQGGNAFEKMRAAEELDWRLRQATGIAKAPYVADFIRMLVDSGEKVLLYGWHREVYNIWQAKLADLAPSFFTGEESTSQKEEAKRRFVDGETSVLIMSLRAGAGIDGLQGVCKVVVYGELDWSPGVHEQGTGRIYRDGQADPVVAYYLLSDSGSDPVLVDALGLKRQQVDGIRDPHSALITATQADPDRVKRLAAAVIERHGRAPAPAAAVAAR